MRITSAEREILGRFSSESYRPVQNGSEIAVEELAIRGYLVRDRNVGPLPKQDGRPEGNFIAVVRNEKFKRGQACFYRLTKKGTKAVR